MTYTFPLNNRTDIHFDTHWFTKHVHGPKVWPWWKLVVVHVVRWSGMDPTSKYRVGFNVWCYTRWGAMCHGFSHLKDL